MAYKGIPFWIKMMLGTSLLGLLSVNVQAEAQKGSLLSITEEAQILPMQDRSGNYMLKSDGFYCLNEDGEKDAHPAVHYFENFVIDGTVFDGYYYHDESGKFAAGSAHIVSVSGLEVSAEGIDQKEGQEGETEVSVLFDGLYMVNNLGKLTAAPQVRYIDQLTVNNVVYDGFYYFNENGQMETEPGVHKLSMNCGGIEFEGSYYFGGENGVLLQKKGMTEEGFSLDKNGRIKNLDQLGIKNLRTPIQELFDSYEGTWEIYIKDLDQGNELMINNQPLYSASLIKAFVMAKTYQDLEEVVANQAERMGQKESLSDTEDGESPAETKVMDLLWNMITVSDNESFNELVRLQTASYDFGDGARAVNEFLEEEGFRETSVQHTLAPSASQPVGIGGRNMTSVRDCGKLLEQIYNEECVSSQASQEMLELLLNQKVTTKIPQGIEEYVEIANKTGETDTDQHDIAIVYGEKTTYILCVMSENCPQGAAVNQIQDISGLVYQYMNLFDTEEE